MIGVVLAAGGGTRLRPLTDDLPKTLLTVDGDRSILELAVANLAQVGIDDALLVTGHASAKIADVAPELQRRYGVTLELAFNDRYRDWNNAYSLWLARETLAQGALLVNGDTVHPVDAQHRLLAAAGAADIVIALDDAKPLGEEEMKVRIGASGAVERISKQLDPADVHGEYIGLTLIRPTGAELLANSLQAVFERDPSLYYEDGFQEYVDRGGVIRTASVGGVSWIEVDDHDDLARAREIACRY